MAKKSPAPKTVGRYAGLPTPADFIAANPRPKTGVPCWICAHPEVAKWLDEVVALGGTTLKQIRAQLQKPPVSFPFTEDSIRRHLREHTAKK